MRTKSLKKYIDKTSRKKFHIHVQLLSIILISLGLVFFIMTIVGSVSNTRRYNAVTNGSEKYLEAENYISQLRVSSDAMTEQSRRVVNTERSKYILSYFIEVDNDERKKALDGLTELLGDDYPDAILYMNSAYMKSISLQDREIHAMRLIVEVAGISIDSVPDELRAYELSSAEQKMTTEELRNKAYELINSESYAVLKSSINDDLNASSNLVRERMMDTVNQLRADYDRSAMLLRICVICSLIIMMLIAGSLLAFLVFPVRRNILAIQKDEKMPPCLSYEMDYLVTVFNELHEKNANDKLGLKMKAEHDALTGLLNRTAFDELCETFTEEDQKLALMILDVDDFKEINDMYGHDIGDQSLRRVSELLLEHFRSYDYIVRYGGDEFIVLMTNVTWEQKDIIAHKLKSINRVLSRKDEHGVPGLTLSGGIAFSTVGYSQELFQRADIALYRVKENGKSDFIFM